MMKLTKRLLSLALVMILCLGLLVSVQAEQTAEFGTATSFQTGEYILVVSGITPTGMSRGDYYITGEEANNPGLLFNAFDPNHPGGATYWKVTRISDTECTVQNEALGDNGYLNMSANTLKYGAKQNLKYQFIAGQCKFYVTVGGTNYYIRFTNSTNNESRFHAGTGDGSNLFKLYGMITPEPEPDLPTSSDADLPLPDEEPLLTVACVSDMHADYGLQSDSPYVRNSVIETLNRISLEEDADILLVGGDNTSDNAKMSEKGGWSYQTYQNVIETYRRIAKDATASGRSLWACGNHDYQAGEDDGYDAYAGYESIMTESCGTPLSVYRQKDDKTLSDQRYPDYIMGLHYNIEGFDFIVLNPPYSKALSYSSGGFQWLRERLASIPKDRTVFLLTHYPFTDGRGISTPTYGLQGSHYSTMMSILMNYPNVIYLYGHNHGGAESVYISEDTFERITSYTRDGRVINNRNVIPSSFISSFMGSMSYYSYSLNPQSLTAADPEIVQALMIYVYGDRIVFQMKNYGQNQLHANRQLKTWTVMRDVAASLGIGSSGTPGAGAGSGTSTDSGSSSSSVSSNSGTTDLGGGSTDGGSFGSTDGGGSSASSNTGASTNSDTGSSPGGSINSDESVSQGDDSMGSGSGGGSVSSDPGFSGAAPDDGDDEYVPEDSGVSNEEESTFVPPVIDTEVNVTKPSENVMNANIAGSADALKQAILTDYEQQWAADGYGVQIYLTAKDVGNLIADAEKSLVQKQVGDGTVGAWLGLELFSRIEGEDAVQVTKTKSKITVTVTLPDTLKNKNSEFKRSYSVLQVSGETVTVLPSRYDSASGTMTFETDTFTSVALTYKDAAVSATDTQTGGASDTVTDLVTGEGPTDSGSAGTPVASDPANSDGKDKGGLSVGAMIGIVAGVVVLAGGGFCLWYFVLRKKPSATEAK